MKLGVPREVKDQEFRVGLSPSSVQVLVEQGHSVWIESEAGVGAGFPDEAYKALGATIVQTPQEAWSQDLIVKVKEPLEQEYGFLRNDHLLLTYLHLAAGRPLTEALLQSGVTAIAYECTLPYVSALATQGIEALAHNDALRLGLVTQAGRLIHPDVQRFSRICQPRSVVESSVAGSQL
jgi:alanine dehydrogenase